MKFYLVSIIFVAGMGLTAVSAPRYPDPASVNAAPGANLLPVPRKVTLSPEKIVFNNSWTISTSSNISKNDGAINSLVSEVKERYHFTPAMTGVQKPGQRVIRLVIKQGLVRIGNATDTNRTALMKQAYRLNLNTSEVVISANAPAGLFYGVQTFLQLLTAEGDKISFPKGQIEDWPDLEMRTIYWDDAHHLEKLPALKRIINQAAHYKINGFTIKLEGHFQFKNAKPLVEPFAYTPAEFQELTNYAKERHVELIPFIDAPAHVSFILKHPEYASLRGYADNNYYFSMVNPGVDSLLMGMFNDLFEANKGGKYVYLSTDEAYYAGMPDNEKAKAKAAGGNGRFLVHFINRLADQLHKKGRTVLIWGEYPVTPEDIPYFSSHIVNSVYDKDVAALYKKNGMRQVIYTSTQGMEPYFPSYYTYPANKFAPSDTAKSLIVTDDEMAQGELSKGRVDGLLTTISSSIAEKKSDFMGTVVAGWGDSGLNPETFWLGYATGSAAGWNHESMTAMDLTNRFYGSFYGGGSSNMNRIYELMSSQAQFWNDSWEWTPLQLRKPILGNSEGIFETPKELKDQTLLLLPVPAANKLSLAKDWTALNEKRLQAAEKYLKENNELLDLLYSHIQDAERQQYNLRVLLSVAQLCRQNLEMLLDLQRIHSFLKLSANVSAVNAAAAVSLLDQALDQAKKTRNNRNETYRSVVSVWNEEWFPRLTEANGRVYLNIVDDIKDHVPMRTADMSYLIYRQLTYPLDKWAEEVKAVRNTFAKNNNLPLRNDSLNWTNTEQLD